MIQLMKVVPPNAEKNISTFVAVDIPEESDVVRVPGLVGELVLKAEVWVAEIFIDDGVAEYGVMAKEED